MPSISKYIKKRYYQCLINKKFRTIRSLSKTAYSVNANIYQFICTGTAKFNSQSFSEFSFNFNNRFKQHLVVLNSITGIPKTKVYPFFQRCLLLTAQSFRSTIISFRLMITSFSSTMQRFRSTTQSFSSTIHGLASTIQSFSSTIQSFGSTTQSFGSTTQSFRLTTQSFRSTTTSFASTITSLGRNNEIFLDTVLKMCHIQTVKFIEEKGSLFGQRLLFLNKSY